MGHDADGAFEFHILERSGKAVAQVYSNVSHAFDTTGKADKNPDWLFASIDEVRNGQRTTAQKFSRFSGQSALDVDRLTPHRVRLHTQKM